jgi:hypothetical protein
MRSNISLKTSFAPIRIALPGNASYRVEARTSFGHVATDFPITISGATGGDSLYGTIGSGVCLLRLTNSNSSIEIRKSGR